MIVLEIKNKTMNENTLYLIGAPVLLFVEAWILTMLAHYMREKSLKLIFAINVALISSLCLSGITRFLTPYTGVLLAFMISLSLVFIFIYGCLTEKAGLDRKASFGITVVYLGVDLAMKVSLVAFAKIFF